MNAIFICYYYFAIIIISLLVCLLSHKASGLRITQIEYITVSRLEVRHGSHWAKNQCVSRLHSFLEVLGDDPFSCLFQLLETSYMAKMFAFEQNLSENRFSFLLPWARRLWNRRMENYWLITRSHQRAEKRQVLKTGSQSRRGESVRPQGLGNLVTFKVLQHLPYDCLVKCLISRVVI